jgi:Ribbon-helix-helix protein, copG family
MTAASDEADNTGREGPQEKASTRLSINLSTETADALRELAGRKGLSITEGIRRAIAAWQFLEVETSRGNQIAVIEQDGSVRTVVLL